MIDFDKPFTTQDVIHDDVVMVDLAFVRRDKSYFLDRVQYWKNKWRSTGYKTVLVCTNPNLDSIAMLFAAAELGVLIQTSNMTDGPEAFLRRSRGSEMHYINPSFGSTWFNPRNIASTPIGHLPICVMNEKETNADFDANRPTYVPEPINPDIDLIAGEAMGAPDSYIPHTARTYIGGAQMCKQLYTTDDHFGSLNGITHIGLTSQVVIAPLMAGCTYYTMQSFYDLVVMCARNVFTKVWFYELHLKITEWHPNFTIPPNAFKGVTVFVGGNKPSVRTMDVLFNAGAEKLISNFGSALVGPPLAQLHITDTKFDILGSGVGEVFPGSELKITNDQLWAKSVGQSVHIPNLDSEGFFNTGDYAVFKDGQFHMLGRYRIQLEDGTYIYPVDIQTAIQSALDEDIYSYSEYAFDEPTLTDTTFTLYPLSIRAGTILNRCKDQIIIKLRELFKNPSIDSIIIHKVVDDANLFAGRITLPRIKQLIAEGKTL